MTLEHTAPFDFPKHKNPGTNRMAKAPFNFIPLPEAIVITDPPPDHDKFSGLSGYFTVKLTTQSPIYIRGLLTEREFKLQENNKDIDENEINKDTPFRKIVKNKPDFINYGDATKPVIPGSSLRGMIRNLFEIVTYSKIQHVSNVPKIFYRAVAADREDAQKEEYKEIVSGKTVVAGYLEHKDGEWWVHPAKSAKSVDEKLLNETFIKVRKDSTVIVDIPIYKGLDDPKYLPQYFDVTFDVGQVSYINSKGEEKTLISACHVSNQKKLTYQGVLVTTGNMLETYDGDKKSPRKNVYLIPEPLEKD
jgi:CRISPR-associated protein (TIGR03986 family)